MQVLEVVQGLWEYGRLYIYRLGFVDFRRIWCFSLAQYQDG